MFRASKITEKNVLGIITRIKPRNWKRVNDQPCIHTFYGRYYINLCLWHPNGVKTISIDVDDIKNGRSDVVYLELQDNSIDFQRILNAYNRGLSNSVNIAAYA